MNNKERYNQIIDEAYKNYNNYMIENFMETRWCKVEILPDGKGIIGRKCNKDEFIIESKTQPGFSERWGLKIEERELSLEERLKIWVSLYPNRCYDNTQLSNPEATHSYLDGGRLDGGPIPRRAISLTYNNETIEIYK